jgi:hypothetical protein
LKYRQNLEQLLNQNLSTRKSRLHALAQLRREYEQRTRDQQPRYECTTEEKSLTPGGFDDILLHTVYFNGNLSRPCSLDKQQRLHCDNLTKYSGTSSSRPKAESEPNYGMSKDDVGSVVVTTQTQNEKQVSNEGTVLSGSKRTVFVDPEPQLCLNIRTTGELSTELGNEFKRTHYSYASSNSDSLELEIVKGENCCICLDEFCNNDCITILQHCMYIPHQVCSGVAVKYKINLLPTL